jgi:hypothetical protein
MSRFLTIAGLFLTLVGSALLFFYGLPKKTVGNVVFIGDTAMKFDAAPGQEDVPAEEWQPAHESFRKRAVLLNRTGFAFVAVGTLLQLVAAW